MMFTHLAKNMHLRAYWRIQNSHANQSVSISEERLCFRRAFRFQNAVSVSEFVVSISECRFCFRISRSYFRMPFVFQNFAFQFRNAVSVSEFCVLISECRFCFGSALSALCHHMN